MSKTRKTTATIVVLAATVIIVIPFIFALQYLQSVYVQVFDMIP